ncbi:MAG: 5-(carboxyamino)imidazole ribonucleotide synthase [Candidatus Bipolaricaulota bacterium]|nr:5-(carboxyamino)imidazole ribonucleotide synthase [Candidatus Bipolaricaulota bacterium]
MRVGILGGGQLGRMLAIAGLPLGVRCWVLDPSPEAPARAVATHICADYRDRSALEQLVQAVDVITYEFENVPVESARALAELRPVYPPPRALAIAQDRLSEKTFFQSLGIPTPRFERVDTLEDLRNAVAELGLPALLKTRRGGYDGKGQYLMRGSDDIERAWGALGGVPLILEEHIAFERELSVIAVRSRAGECAFYPLIENYHREGILRRSLAPAPKTSPERQARAERYARAILEALNYVGVLALELFEHHGNLLANEMAPRVHNSGHWTIEGAVTSQFENHLRAIGGWPLGTTDSRGHCAMINLIGTTPSSEAVLKIPGAHLHLYGKSPRPGRKLGHITLCEPSEELLAQKLAQAQALLDSGTPAEE